MEPKNILNIAGYKFAPLANLEELRTELLDLCRLQQLMGTILLSHEGINVFLAGLRPCIEAVLARLRTLRGFEDFLVKESFSVDQPFDRLRVRIKKEIIAFGIPGVEPAKYTSRRVTAEQLRQWLDDGEPVTLLDTRNNYEIEVGTFANAVLAGIDDFRKFPDAVVRLPASLKPQRIVTFCTGGIRCEKAAPYLEREGFRDVYQLDGGILNYFEKCGNAHFNGDCWVFDLRGALDAALNETGIAQCQVCDAIVYPDDQNSPDYVIGKSCPKCVAKSDTAAGVALAARLA